MLKPLAKGLASFIPGSGLFLPKQGTKGTDSPLYCFEVWMKHLVMLWAHGMRSIPGCLIELGPGDSLGVGLAAMLSGVSNYVAVDTVRYSDMQTNLRIFDELVNFFQKRTALQAKGWPAFGDYIDSNRFPSAILTEELLKASLSEERIALIRKAISSPDGQNTPPKIRYIAPWAYGDIISECTADVILSHSVLEHARDLPALYRLNYRWLKPGGFLTHQIDFKSHDVSIQWNGHYAYSRRMWNIVLGKRAYFINRQPCSAHLGLIRENGFKEVCCLKRYEVGGIGRKQLSKDWRTLSDDDLACSGLFIQAQKQQETPHL